MSQEVLFSESEKKMILRYRNKARVTSFSETFYPFLLFLAPSVFLFVLFLFDEQKVTAVMAYIALVLPYILSMFSAHKATVLFAEVLEKYQKRLRETPVKDDSED